MIFIRSPPIALVLIAIISICAFVVGVAPIQRIGVFVPHTVQPTTKIRLRKISQKVDPAPFSPIVQCKKQMLRNKIVTPINFDRLSRHLEGYDINIKNILVNGFKFGFDIGYRGVPNSNINVSNLKSALERPIVVSEKIRKELEANRLVGPFPYPPFEFFQINPIGLVPKKEPDTFRLITHLSSPPGQSINDGIDHEFSEVHYSSIQDAISLLINLGKGVFMAKCDIRSAFRLLPVLPEQYHLLGMKWNDNYYFDKCMPMGARSSCNLFELFSTCLEFISKKKQY